jgi:hypothetical protein
MRTVQEIVNKSGGFSRLKQAEIRIENEPHMPLVIQYLDKSGFNDCDYLRVSQLETIDGTFVRDTEICIECDADGTNWKPVYWNSDITRKKIYVYTAFEVDDNRCWNLIDMDAMRDLKKLADVWDEDLAALEYLKATPENRQGNLFEAG